MLRVLFLVLSSVATLLLAPIVTADEISIEVECPDTIEPGFTPALVANVENRFCSPLTVRLISSVVGNAAGSLEGVGITGPDVVVSSAVVPAATPSPSTCSFGSCSPSVSYTPCVTNADCACANSVPGAAAIPYSLSAPIPLGFAESVVRQFTFLDVPGQADQSNATCLIAVPEPSLSASGALWLGAAMLTVFHRRRVRPRGRGMA